MDFANELDIYLRARFTLIVLVTHEEERALEALKTICESCGRPLFSWDLVEGFRKIIAPERSTPPGRDVIEALDQIEKAGDNGVYALRDFHACWINSRFQRKLRNVAQRLKFRRNSIVIITPSAKIPDELRDEAVVIEFPHPCARELEDELNRLADSPDVPVRLTELGREKIVQAALGMTAAQARRIFSRAIVEYGVLDDRAIDLVNMGKKQVIRETEALEFHAVSESPDNVGGLGVLKEWLNLRELAFTREAREYGLPAPKGIALIGIPGTGKSLTARMISGLWHLPLLRLDVGALYGSLVGESEERTRRALRMAETIAPCVIWIDEIEKALAHGGLDSGTSERVFGTIITWMAEKTAPCFIVATANDISNLPPELMRKGRFDEIFFLDLPTVDERREIFSVHLKKRRRIATDFDIPRLAAESEGYVGAEIEQAVIDAMYIGFNAGREFTTEDISASLKRLVPLSVSQREVIEKLRNWLRERRAQSASFNQPDEAEQRFVPLRPELN